MKKFEVRLVHLFALECMVLVLLSKTKLCEVLTENENQIMAEEARSRRASKKIINLVGFVGFLRFRRSSSLRPRKFH